MLNPPLQQAFVAHLLALIEAKQVAEDAKIASTLVASADDTASAARFLASALFIFQLGQIPHIRRRVVQTSAFEAARANADDKCGVARLIAQLEHGGPALDEARSHQARQVLRRSQAGTQFIFLDRCFVEWGVHHFHVYPNERKRDRLVYAAFDDVCVYLLALGTHASLHNQQLVEAMSEVCPHLLATVNGVTGDVFSVDEVRNIRNKNVGFATSSPLGAVVP